MSDPKTDIEDDSPENEWGQLGSTTSARSWIALVALFLILAAGTIWGLVGRIPVQTTLPATISTDGFPIQIAAGHSGSIASYIGKTKPGQGTNSSQVFLKGQTLLFVRPFGGGKPIPIVAPVDMTLALRVVDGAPVDPTTVVANGYQVSNDQEQMVYAALSLADVSVIKDAQRLTVATSDPRLSIKSLEIKLDRVGQVPLSEQQIATVLANPIAAKQAFTAASGAPYAVFFKPISTPSLNARVSVPATITVTEQSPHPLSLLFSSAR